MYHDLTFNILGKFSSFSIQKLPWKDNQHADVMASATSLITLEEGVLDFQFTIHSLIELDIHMIPCYICKFS